MYNKYFGFKEKPFKLVPNPEYLFLSKSHEEALAHLSFAIYHGDGFVEIIGEVGTGKTTLCRVFLENLDKSIEAAYIFNPKLDALQLLKVINDEFDIDSAPDNTKDLIDKLNSFLINKKSAGQKVLVLIDEAQNLSLEVLEQLRLLSNLETTQEKLLQIILVGQPELGELLSSHQLRQLGQRITINCQLTPLTFSETKDYIKHRIALASNRAGPPFDNASLRAIYEYSRGVPRLINIACDRALLNAFSLNSFKITGSITKEAIRELERVKTSISPRRRHVPSYIAFASVIIFALIGTFFYKNFSDNSIHLATSKTYSLPDVSRINMNIRPDASDAEQQEESRNQEQGLNSAANPLDATVEPQGMISKPGESTPAAVLSGIIQSKAAFGEGKPDMVPASAELSSSIYSYAGNNETEENIAAEQFLNFLKSLNSRHSRNTAMLQAAESWSTSAAMSNQLLILESDQSFFREAAKENELLIQPMATDAGLSILEVLNLPAILTFYLPNHAWPKYLALAGLDAENAYLDAGDQGEIITVARKILLRIWSGEAYIVWKNFIGLDNIIKAGSPVEAVRNLKVLLRDLAYTGDITSGRYDAGTSQFIKDIQRKNGLQVDGIVGPFTQIVLYNEKPDFIKPSLITFKAAKTETDN